jgi:hypothetical protein
MARRRSARTRCRIAHHHIARSTEAYLIPCRRPGVAPAEALFIIDDRAGQLRRGARDERPSRRGDGLSGLRLVLG